MSKVSIFSLSVIQEQLSAPRDHHSALSHGPYSQFTPNSLWYLDWVFLPGESQGWQSLVGCHLWGRTVGHDWSDLAAAAAGREENVWFFLLLTSLTHCVGLPLIISLWWMEKGPISVSVKSLLPCKVTWSRQWYRMSSQVLSTFQGKRWYKNVGHGGSHRILPNTSCKS